MAVYAEHVRPVLLNKQDVRSSRSAAESKAAPAPAAGSTYSPSTTISFEPNAERMEKLVFKYQWRETLCRQVVAPECAYNKGNSGNRMWQEEGFAPPPPTR